jgi:hypothetical protein
MREAQREVQRFAIYLTGTSCPFDVQKCQMWCLAGLAYIGLADREQYFTDSMRTNMWRSCLTTQISCLSWEAPHLTLLKVKGIGTREPNELRARATEQNGERATGTSHRHERAVETCIFYWNELQA